MATLRWGGDLQGGEPYVFQDPADGTHVVGFEVEIAEALAKRLGGRATFVQNDWQMLIPSLERGDFDIVLNGLEVTPARAGAGRIFRGRTTVWTERSWSAGRMRRAFAAWPTSAADAWRRSGARSGTTCCERSRRGGGAARGRRGAVHRPRAGTGRRRWCSINIIAARYGIPRATLAQWGTSARASTRSPSVPPTRSSRVAVDAALDDDDGGRRAARRSSSAGGSGTSAKALLAAGGRGNRRCRTGRLGSAADVQLFLRGAADHDRDLGAAMLLAVAGGSC